MGKSLLRGKFQNVFMVLLMIYPILKQPRHFLQCSVTFLSSNPTLLGVRFQGRGMNLYRW